MLTGGVVAVQSSGRGLVTERLAGVQQQAAIAASALANYATDPVNDATPLNLLSAQSLLKELSEVGKRHGVSIADVACRWVLDRPQVRRQPAELWLPAPSFCLLVLAVCWGGRERQRRTL